MRDTLELIRDDEGQAMAEWIILSAFLVLALVVVFGYFPSVVGNYYANVVNLLCLPLP